MQGRAVAFIPSQASLNDLMERTSEKDTFGIPSPNLYLICYWLAALSSGRFDQIHGRLRKTYDQGQGFCASGLGCETVRRAFPDNYAWGSEIDTETALQNKSAASQIVWNLDLEPHYSNITSMPVPISRFLGLNKKIWSGHFTTALSAYNKHVAKKLHHSWARLDERDIYLETLVVRANDLGVSFSDLAHTMADVYRDVLGWNVPTGLVRMCEDLPEDYAIEDILDAQKLTLDMAPSEMTPLAKSAEETPTPA